MCPRSTAPSAGIEYLEKPVSGYKSEHTHSRLACKAAEENRHQEPRPLLRITWSKKGLLKLPRPSCFSAYFSSSMRSKLSSRNCCAFGVSTMRYLISPVFGSVISVSSMPIFSAFSMGFITVFVMTVGCLVWAIYSFFSSQALMLLMDSFSMAALSITLLIWFTNVLGVTGPFAIITLLRCSWDNRKGSFFRTSSYCGALAFGGASGPLYGRLTQPSFASSSSNMPETNAKHF